MNSFGFGGTNAHVILESAPETAGFPIKNGVKNGFPKLHCQDLERVERVKVERVSKPQLCIISSKSKASLVRTIANLKTWIVNHGHKPGQLQNLAQTLNTRRSFLNWRSSIVGSVNLDDTLSALGRARMSKVSIAPHVVFLFTGQGAQYACMGRELLSVSTAFLNSLQKSQCVLQDLGASWNLLDELQAPESLSRINLSELSQPATTAIQIALIDLLADLNVRPTAVIGHSSGEVAGAYSCGALTREDALKISYYKGFVAGWCKEVIREKGAMLAIGLSEAEVAHYLKLIQADRASVACVNSPSSVTVSGDEAAILSLKTILDANSIFTRLLKVDIAYHSQHMCAVSRRFEQSISNLSSGAPQPQVKFFSSVSASQLKSDITHSYWVDNLVSKVRFSEALELLVETYRATGSEPISFLEIGPHAALQGPVRQTMAALKSEYPKWSYSPTLVRGHNAHVATLGTMGSLFEQGVPLNFTKADFMYPDEPNAEFKLARDLSSYAWDHSCSHWHESRLSREYRFRRHAPHDLLGLRMTGTTTLEPIFRHILSVDDLPWLQEHMIDGFALYPGSAFLVQAIEGLKQISQDRGEIRKIARYALKNMEFSKALVVPNSPAMVEVLLSFKPSRSSNERLGLNWQEFRVSSQSQDGTWNEHCTGLIRAIFEPEKGVWANGMDLEEDSAVLKKRIIRAAQSSDVEILTAELYENLRRNGVDYGENFSIIKELLVGDHRAIGTVQIPDIQKCMPSGRVQPHVIHPAVFDAFMHIALPLYHRRCSEGPVMLTSIGEAMISADILKRPGDQLVVECKLTQAKQRFGAVNVTIFQGDAQGRMLEVGSLTQEEFRSIGEGQKEGSAVGLDSPSCYKIDWIPIDRVEISPNRSNPENAKICFMTQSGLTQDLAVKLASHFRNRCKILTVPCDFNHMDIDSVLVVIDDKVAEGFDSETPVFQTPGGETQFARLKSVLWVTMNSASDGDLNRVSAEIMARRAKQQLADQKFITLTYQDIPGNGDVISSLVNELIERSFGGDDEVLPLETDYAYKHGVLMVPKMKLHGPSSKWLSATQDKDLGEESAGFHSHGRALKLDFKTPGLLTSARFVENYEAQTPLASDEVDVKVYALAVNQTDVSISLGRAEATETMSGEISGVVIAAGTYAQAEYSPGDRVCGWGSKTPYANTARIKAHLLQHMGGSLSYVEGASIPSAFQTAYHALVDIARLERPHKLLIHGAAGGVGQAAIQLALHIGAEVYVTVGSEAKVQLLTKTAGLPRQHVFSSRSTAFQEDIARLTKGSGVDVVLNCCAADLAEASLSCIAEFGFLINVVKSSVGLVSPSLRRNVSIVSIDMITMKEECSQTLSSKFKKVMTLYNAGVLRPISSTILPISDLVDAFKLVNSQKYAGKVVLTAEEGNLVKKTVQVPPTPKLSSEGTYIVLGGPVDLNLRLCIFLAGRGAANIFSIIFAHAGQQRQLNQSQELRKRNVRWNCIDLLHSDALSDRALISKSLEGFPPVKGFFHVERGFQVSLEFSDCSRTCQLTEWRIIISKKSLAAQFRTTWKTNSATIISVNLLYSAALWTSLLH